MLLIAQEASGWSPQFTLQPLREDYGIPLAVMGILVVFAALLLVSLFITLLPRLTAVLDNFFQEEREHAGVAKQPQDEDELSEEILVVIAAAVAESMGRPHRIVHVRGLTPEELGWSFEGRLQHHTSHTFRRQDRR